MADAFDYLTVTQAARELGMSRVGVSLRIRHGEMTAYRIGPSTTLIPREEVERWKVIGKRGGGRPRPGSGAHTRGGYTAVEEGK